MSRAPGWVSANGQTNLHLARHPGGSVRIVDLNKVDNVLNQDKFYHAYLICNVDRMQNDGRFHVLFHWGRNGTTGQRQTSSFIDIDDAEKAWASKISTKVNEGYEILTPDRWMAPIPAHIMDRAGIRPVFQSGQVQTDYDVLQSQISFAITGVTGTDEEFNRTLISRQQINTRLSELEEELIGMRGQVDVVDLLIRKRLP